MHVGQLRAAGLAKEGSVGGTVTTPTEYLAYIPPLSFMHTAHELISTAVSAKPDINAKASLGPIDLDNLKVKYEAGPENIGNILMGVFGADVKTGAVNTGYTHTFKRASVVQLPTYSLWADRGVDFPVFAGAMVNKLDIDVKAKEFVIFDADMKAISYTAGSSKSPSYSAYKPFVFSNAVVKIATVQVNNYADLKISFENVVNADHVLNNSHYPGKIYSEGFKAKVSLNFVVEDTTEYAKYLAGTSSVFEVILTHNDDITGADPGTKPVLDIILPEIYYTAAPFPNPKGLLMINFTAEAVYNVSAGYTAQASLINSVSTAY